MLIIGVFFLLNLLLIAWCVDFYSQAIKLIDGFKNQISNCFESSQKTFSCENELPNWTCCSNTRDDLSEESFAVS